MSAATSLFPVSGDEAAIRSLIESVGRAHLLGIGAQLQSPFGNFAGPSPSNAWGERWETPLSFEWKNLRIDIVDNVARCDGFLRVSATKKGAERPTRSWKCVSIWLQRIEDQWRLVHVHFRSVTHGRNSVPVQCPGDLG